MGYKEFFQTRMHTTRSRIYKIILSDQSLVYQAIFFDSILARIVYGSNHSNETIMFSTSTYTSLEQGSRWKCLPREILSQIIVGCDTLHEVKNLCEAEEIVLNKEELNLLSEKYKLPYATQENGLTYLLICSQLRGVDIIQEFLKHDDARVLEYHPTKDVTMYLFPKREMHCFFKIEQEAMFGQVVRDCPRIVTELFKRKEWNGIYEKEVYNDSYFPLEYIVLNRCNGMLEVLLKCTTIPVPEAILSLSIGMINVEAFRLLISSSNISEDINWISLIVIAYSSIRNHKNSEAEEILSLFIRHLVKENKTSFLTTSDLKWLKKETIQELHNLALEQGNTKLAELLLKTGNLQTM